MPDIRPAEADDLTRIVDRLVSLPLLRRYNHSAAGLRQSLATALGRGEQVWIFDDGEPRGLVWFSVNGTFGLGGYLRLLAVDASAQEHGIGTRLLSVFERETYAASKHAFLLVSDFNKAAQRFYVRHGYREVGALPGLVLTEVAEQIFWKPRPG